MILLSIAFALTIVILLLLAIALRRVVASNEVHIVQSSKETKSYGKDSGNGNIYYEWPTWVPLIGIIKTILPVSVFDLRLNAYEAYDKGRLPFVVDIVSFFRINDSNLSAQRVASFSELERQITSIVQGAIRTVLASHEIDDIMLERSRFGEQFTKEVEGQLENWGVIAVKNIELMDIRDANGNQVIHNIMQKKKSLIEMQSRSEVAENMKKAQIAEIDAGRDTETQKQLALQTIGVRTAEKEMEVGIATQKASQAMRDEEKITKQKEMAVIKVVQVSQADIDKDVKIVEAEKNKQTSIIMAEGTKQTVITTAQGSLESQRLGAEGISLQGLAKAEAEKAMQLAPVQAQIELAKEIGSNDSYQQYLVTIRQIEANQVIGVEQAKALDKADIKIIANTGNPVEGVKNVMDLFSSQGGTNIGSMIEGLAQSESGKALIDRFVNKK